MLRRITKYEFYLYSETTEIIGLNGVIGVSRFQMRCVCDVSWNFSPFDNLGAEATVRQREKDVTIPSLLFVIGA